LGRPAFLAAAIVVATAAVLLAAAAEQDQQNDDPAQITTAEAVVTKVTHKDTSMKFDVAHRHSSHVMIQEEKCAPEAL
jgi:Na+-transporting NADH:ubiquinone oxidoreductase subunit NqrC